MAFRRVSDSSSSLGSLCIELFAFITAAATTATSRTCQFIVQPPIPTKHGSNFFIEPLIWVGDFDGDHRLDVLRLVEDLFAIEFFLGYANNSFRAQQDYFYNKEPVVDGQFSYMLLSVADLNRDHHLDLIFKYAVRHPMDVSYGFGNGSFQNRTPISTVSYTPPTRVAFGDLNNDTYVDLVIALVTECEIVVHLGSHNGTFSIASDHRMNVSMEPWNIVLADFTADGILDLVYGNDNGHLGILLGVGNGSLHLEQTRSIPSKETIQTIIPRDLNEDGLVDLVLVYVGRSDLLVMWNEGNRTFRNIATDHIRLPTSNCFQIGDLNNDQHLDIAAADDPWNKNIKLYFGFGNGSFAASNKIVSVSDRVERCFQLGDFNGDDRLDLVIPVHGNLLFVLNHC